MKVSEQLNLAADIIQVRGWNQDGVGWITEGTGPVCIEGGILAARGEVIQDMDLDQIVGTLPVIETLPQCPAYQAVHRYLNLPEQRRLFSWNDRSNRTQEQVIEVLRAAAAVEAAREEAVVTADA